MSIFDAVRILFYSGMLTISTLNGYSNGCSSDYEIFDSISKGQFIELITDFKRDSTKTKWWCRLNPMRYRVNEIQNGDCELIFEEGKRPYTYKINYANNKVQIVNQKKKVTFFDFSKGESNRSWSIPSTNGFFSNLTLRLDTVLNINKDTVYKYRINETPNTMRPADILNNYEYIYVSKLFGIVRIDIYYECEKCLVTYLSVKYPYRF